MNLIPHFLFFLLGCSALCAQGIITDLNSPQVTLANLSQAVPTSPIMGNMDLSVSQMGALINQEGNANTVELQTSADTNGVFIDQIGDENTILLNLRANRIDYSVRQNGNNNMLLEYNVQANKQLLQRRIEQSGNGQNLIIHGQNSIMDRMQIIMKGSQSVIIRNTN